MVYLLFGGFRPVLIFIGHCQFPCGWLVITVPLELIRTE